MKELYNVDYTPKLYNVTIINKGTLIDHVKQDGERYIQIRLAEDIEFSMLTGSKRPFRMFVYRSSNILLYSALQELLRRYTGTLPLRLPDKLIGLVRTVQCPEYYIPNITIPVKSEDGMYRRVPATSTAIRYFLSESECNPDSDALILQTKLNKIKPYLAHP